MYAKQVKEICVCPSMKKAKNLREIQVDGSITNLMLGTCVLPKYVDPRRHLVDVVINGTVVEGSLDDLGAAISVMKVQMMHILGLIESL